MKGCWGEPRQWDTGLRTGVSRHTGGVTAEAGCVGASEHPNARRGCGVGGAAPLQEPAAPSNAAGVQAEPSRNH